MKIAILSSAILGFASMEAAAFTLNAKTFRTSTSTNKIISPNSSTTALHLKAADILARARKAAGQPEEEEEPQIFTDEILDDMQQSLLTLERRIKDGPGCLSADDVTALDGQLNRIIVDMKDYIASGKGNDSTKPVMLAASVAATTATPAAAPVAAPAAPAPAPAPAPVVAQDEETPEYYETNDEEGAAYDGEGGMGLASGTANTWIIPGMDEMTGEEYRAALQETVSARQSQRKKGTVGNRNSNNYLDALSKPETNDDE